MTDELREIHPGPDMRANAWLAAWDRIESAQKLIADHRGRVRDPLPEVYWATLEEAAILTRLAQVDEDPAREVGTFLVQRAESARQGAELARDAMDRAMRKRKDDPTTGAGHQRACCPTMYGNPHVEGCSFEPRPDNPIDYGGPAVVFDPPFSEGHRVRLTRGDWFGRTGEVANVLHGSTPPQLDVMLDPQVHADTGRRHPMETITVPTTDVVFVG